MALKLTLKPGEKMILGGAVITNAGARCELIVENEVPVLRQKNIMNEKQADSPARRIYFVVQLMYVDEKNLATHHNLYWQLVREFIMAAPSAVPIIDVINEHIVNRDYYRALKAARKLINYEREAIESAKQRSQNIRRCG